MREPAPPIVVPHSPPVAPRPEPVAVAVAADPALGELWFAIVQALDAAGSIAAMARELALNAGLVAQDSSRSPERWTLQVASELLRADAQRERLEAALLQQRGIPVVLELLAGEPVDTPAKRHAAERQRRQAAAEAQIHGDPVVQTLLAQFKTARLVPGSVRPA
jgi:DNA polymerase-3 subunit gamma/tau